MPKIEFKSDWMPLATGLDTDTEVFSVGDVHGFSSHLEVMLEEFSRDKNTDKKAILISLGDLIDRGPHSIACIDLMQRSSEFGFAETYTLMGNHEQMMKLCLTGKRMTEFSRYIPQNAYVEAYEIWSWNGSKKTLAELNLDLDDLQALDIKKFARILAEALGPQRMTFLDNLLSHKQIGSLLFVHAGINPDVSISEALAEPWDCLYEEHWSWIRGKFLYEPFNHPYLIPVHGHTYPGALGPGFDPSLMNYREGKINLDAGSYRTGKVAGTQFAKDKYRIYIVSD